MYDYSLLGTLSNLVNGYSKKLLQDGLDRNPVSLMYTVYCQGCGKELTQEGGIVSTTGNIYCNGSLCFEKEIIPMIKKLIPKNAVGFHYLTPETVQSKIKEKELVSFGPLEKKI